MVLEIILVFLIGVIIGCPMYVGGDYVAIKLNRADSRHVQREIRISANYRVVSKITVCTSGCVMSALMVCFAHITFRAFQLYCKDWECRTTNYWLCVATQLT